MYLGYTAFLHMLTGKSDEENCGVHFLVDYAR